MAGPTSPSTEGPTFAPPPLPPGWIAQWDGASKKYYFVQLSTGVSQWDTPTEAAPTGSTPAQPADHPYGTPQPEVITHPDGSQTVRHADGTMEPILPSDGSRGMGGPEGERGFGSMAMNALLSGGKQHGPQNSGSSPFALAGQLFGGSSHGGGHGGSGGGSNPAGKLVGSLVSSLVTPSNKPAQPQNYYGDQNSQQHQSSGGLAGAVMGGVAHMFGGKPAQQTSNFGYSNNGSSGGYTGQAPPTSYQPPGATSQFSTPTANSSSVPSYQAPPTEPQGQYYQQPQSGPQPQPPASSYGPPLHQAPSYGNYPPPVSQQQSHPAYGQHGGQHGNQHQSHGGQHHGGHQPPHQQQAYSGGIQQEQYGGTPASAQSQPGYGMNAQYAPPSAGYNAPYSGGNVGPGPSYSGHPPYNSSAPGGY